MDFIIVFFRDILDGYLYTFVAIICFILICSCIGYLAEVSINKKKEKQLYEETHANIANPIENNNLNQSAPQVANPVVNPSYHLGQQNLNNFNGQIPTAQNPFPNQQVNNGIPTQNSTSPSPVVNTVQSVNTKQ